VTSTTTTYSYGNETIKNVTELIGTNEYNASGVLTYSTTVTNFYTYTEAAGSGSSGGSGSGGGPGGGIAGSGAGVVTSTTVSSFSTKPSFTVQEELEALSGGKARVVKLSKPLDPPSRPGLCSAPSRSTRFPAVPLVVRAAKAAVVAEALVEMHR